MYTNLLRSKTKVLEIVDECFKKENNGDMDARNVAFDESKGIFN